MYSGVVRYTPGMQKVGSRMRALAPDTPLLLSPSATLRSASRKYSLIREANLGVSLSSEVHAGPETPTRAPFRAFGTGRRWTQSLVAGVRAPAAVEVLWRRGETSTCGFKYVQFHGL